MPLAFSSITHGKIAFGFFNIESDMLLLNNYFFFAGDFCDYIDQLAERKPDDFSMMVWRVYLLNQGDIGDLHGAIRGTRLKGFIGEMYRHFPFPKDFLAFKQNPEGYRTRETVKNLIEKYSHISNITVTLDKADKTISIGEYLFSKACFGELLNYIWIGGYPQWKQGKRPDYCLSLKEKVKTSLHPLFQGIDLTE